MKLARKVRLFRSTSWTLAAACFLPPIAVSFLFGPPVVPMLFGSTAIFFGVSSFVPSSIVRGAFARLSRAIEAEELPAARVLLTELLEMYQASPVALERLHFTESTLLVLEGRHAEACRLVESIDRARLGPGMEAWIDNQRAWAMAHCGQATEAVAIAKASLAADRPHTGRSPMVADLRSYQLGTLGAALVLAGEADEGVVFLEQALARGGKPRPQATRAFYLGEGLRMLGRHHEAAKAYARASEIAPQSAYGRRATERATELKPYR